MLADLPSASAAKDLVRGVPGALPRVVGWTTLRAGLIGTGLALSGQRSNVVKGAVVAALVVEAWIVVWAVYER